MPKCPVCGYNHNDIEETCAQVSERVKLLLKGIEISKSGYAGILPNGNIVNRREFPKAFPVEENKMFGIPKPKKI